MFFSDSIKNVLSDLQNKEHENSQTEVIKKNITLLQNEIKSEDTIIESLLKTQKTLTKYLSDQIPKHFQSIENHSQRQLRQHQDYRQHQQQYPQSQAKQHLQQSHESNIAAQKTQQSSPFRRNNLPHQNKVNTLNTGNLFDDTTFSDLYELFGLRSTRNLSGNLDIKMPLHGNTGKRKGFVYITVPDNVKYMVLSLMGEKISY